MDNYSLSDIRAAVDGNGGMGGWGGGDGLIWLVVLFLFGFGGFGGGGFGGNRQDAVSYEILSNQHFNALSGQINNISDGLCQGFYALNNSVMGEGRAIQTQLAGCCCDIQNAIREEGAATRSMIQANEIQSLRDKVTDLQMQASQCRQNEYLVNKLTPPCPVPAYLTCSPYQSYNPCGCGGCGNGF